MHLSISAATISLLLGFALALPVSESQNAQLQSRDPGMNISTQALLLPSHTSFTLQIAETYNREQVVS